MPSADRIFLDYSSHKLHQLEERIETCLTALSDRQIWARGGDNENAVGNLVLHLAGNVRQWIVSGVGGQPDSRQRDGEFDARGGVPATELLASLRKTVEEAAAIIGKVTPEQLIEPRTIQGYQVTVLEAIAHVVEHFSMHTGQIIFATKMLTGADLGFYRHLGGNSHTHDEVAP